MNPDAVHPVESPPMGDVTLADARRRLKGRVCIDGNIQIGDLIALGPAEIDASVRAAIRDAAAGGGLILSTTAAPYEASMSQRTFDNYRQLVSSGRRFGAPPYTV